MHSILKMTTLSLVSAVLVVSTGCSNKRANTSEVVVAPMGIPGNAAYGNSAYGNNAGLVNNSAAIQAAGNNIKGIVYFGYDRSDITGQAASILDQQVAFLSSNSEARVLVAGHTDERGSREYNHALGERRAQAVKSYLAAKGIANVRVETISYGEERPAVVGNNEAAYAQNRRAELSY